MHTLLMVVLIAVDASGCGKEIKFTPRRRTRRPKTSVRECVCVRDHKHNLRYILHFVAAARTLPKNVRSYMAAQVSNPVPKLAPCSAELVNNRIAFFGIDSVWLVRPLKSSKISIVMHHQSSVLSYILTKRSGFRINPFPGRRKGRIIAALVAKYPPDDQSMNGAR